MPTSTTATSEPLGRACGLQTPTLLPETPVGLPRGQHGWVPTCMLGTSSSLESLVRLSIRLFQSSRSTVLGAESQVCTGVLLGQGGLYQLPTPTGKQGAWHMPP